MDYSIVRLTISCCLVIVGMWTTSTSSTVHRHRAATIRRDLATTILSVLLKKKATKRLCLLLLLGPSSSKSHHKSRQTNPQSRFSHFDVSNLIVHAILCRHLFKYIQFYDHQDKDTKKEKEVAQTCNDIYDCAHLVCLLMSVNKHLLPVVPTKSSFRLVRM